MKRIIVATLLSFNFHAAQAVLVTTLRTPNDGLQPQAAVDSKGVTRLIYLKGDPQACDIFYVRCEPGQWEFSKPIQVNSQPHTAMAIGTIRGAQLAVGNNGRVHVVWDGMGQGAGAVAKQDQTPLFYTRLNDAGTAFEPQRNVITFAYGLDGGSSVAADQKGNVYVTWHAPTPGNTNGEAGRAVFIARSTDEGKTFQRETLAITNNTGACACCGMKAFADSSDHVFALYRAAYQMTNRNETLLFSRDKGSSFEMVYSHHWNLAACPMSSASLSEGSGQILAAAETHGRVFFIQLNPETGKVSGPVSPERQAKHPVAIANSKGEILFVWAEGTGWNKGGSVAWQVYDKNLNPTNDKGRADGLPAWSLPTAFAQPDDTFVVVY